MQQIASQQEQLQRTTQQRAIAKNNEIGRIKTKKQIKASSKKLKFGKIGTILRSKNKFDKKF